MTVHLTAGDIDEDAAGQPDQGFALDVDGLPTGPVQLAIDGAPAGTLDVLDCRTVAWIEGQDPNQDFPHFLEIGAQVAYGAAPLTASVIVQPYVVAGWPANRWLANPIVPTADQIAAQLGGYGTTYLCNWFLLPPGSVDQRPGLVQPYTATDTVGQPGVHVLGPGGAVDPTDFHAVQTDSTVDRPFTLRSTLDGSTFTTANDDDARVLIPAGSWIVTDPSGDRQSPLDVAPGRAVRVVAVDRIGTPDGAVATPATTP